MGDLCGLPTPSKAFPPNDLNEPVVARGERMSRTRCGYVHTDAHKYDSLVTDNSVQAVQDDFRAMSLDPNRVHWLVGFFNDTIARAPISRISLLRLDGDMFQSTMQVLEALYPKLSPGGFLVVDDYGYFPQCKRAVDLYFRERAKVSPSWKWIDCSGVWWQKPHE